MRKLTLCFILLGFSLCFGQNISFNDQVLANLLINQATIDTNNDGVADSRIDTNLDGAIQVNETIGITALVLSNNSFGNSSITVDDLALFPDLLNLSISNFPSVGGNLNIIQGLEVLTLRSNASISLIFNSSSILELHLTTGSLSINSDLNSLSNLEILTLDGDFGSNTLNLGNLNQLKELRISTFSLTPVPNIDTLSQLEIIEIDGLFVGLLDVNNNTQLQKITIPAVQLDPNSLIALPNLTDLVINSGGVGFNINVTALDFSNNTQLSLLSISNLPALSSLNLTLNSSLQSLSISNFSVPLLNISSNTNLIQLYIEDNNFLNSIDISGLVLLENLVLNNLNLISTVDVSQNIELRALDLIDLDNLQNIDLTFNLQLEWFNFINNSLITSPLDLSQNINLKGLRLQAVSLPSLDLSHNLELENIYVDQSQFITIDLSSQRDIIQFSITRNLLLQSIFFKTTNNISLGWTLASLGITTFGTTGQNPNLNYICANPEDISFFQNLVSNQVVINSYCSFTPGGDFNEIQGNISIDVDNNGCDPTDPVFSNFNFTATDGTTSGTISSN